MPSNNPLPPKEKALFNRIVKCYEQKQYKNGFKFARQILSNPKFSEHGETLAMKGLTMNCLGKKEEAYDLVKRGLTNDIRSHVCWHVYGLLQRSDKKYDEAIKCYRNALKWDPENLHILRDLSMLQIHMRDMEGHRQTKYTLLQLKPAQRAPWIGYAISNHLLNDFDSAFKILEEFRKTQQSQDARYEYSELLLYQNLMLREDGKLAQALEHLKDNEDKILDKCTVDEIKGDLCLQLNDLKSAEEIFIALIDRNPENLKYYERLESILCPQNNEERVEIYDVVSERHPRSDAPRYLPLRFLQAPSQLFHDRLDAFMRRQMKRGVPPLLITLKELYEDEQKVETITSLARDYVTNLQLHHKFHPDDNEVEQPTSLLWALSFYGQHLDQIGEHKEALEMLDQAIAHTPTLIELHVARAKTLKHLGDMEGAASSMDEAQSLDTADRFINCKCVRYLIRNGQLQQAETIAAKFTRENVSVDEYAKEMQCMWYELEVAQAHKRAGKLGEALSKCHQIDKHFHEITQDQLEFHQYCIRKTTLNAYTRLLKLEDDLREHDFYLQAARIAIQVYVQLHDEPYQSGDDVINTNEANMSSAELKKLKNKQRKAERKKAALAEKKKQEQERINKRKQQAQKLDEGNNEKKKEDEFQPEVLVSTSAPIEEARKFLIPLQQHRFTCFDTHYYDVMISQRRHKPLVMLRALNRLIRFSSNDLHHAQVHLSKIIFLHKVANSKLEGSVVDDIIKRHLVELLPTGYDVTMTSKLNDEFIARNSNSLPHLFAGARAMYHLDEKRQDESLKLVTEFDEEKTTGISLKLCVEIDEAMKGGKLLGHVAHQTQTRFASKCAQMFPRANAFGYRHCDVTQDCDDAEPNGHPQE